MPGSGSRWWPGSIWGTVNPITRYPAIRSLNAGWYLNWAVSINPVRPAGMEFAVDQLVEFAMPNGQTLAGRIMEIDDDAVKVDFNHPLADLSIEFEVEIVRIL